MAKGFLTDLSTAMLFYRFCRRYNITKLQPRIAVMRELTKRKQAKYIRDPQEFIRGKRALFIKSKEEKE